MNFFYATYMIKSTNIKFTDLFNEGSIIKFAPTDLDKNIPEIQEFKRKLKDFESEYSFS